MITSLSELGLKFWRFILLVQKRKEWFLWALTAAQVPENYEYEWSFSSRSTNFKDILPQNMSQFITKIVSICMRIVMSFAMKRAIPFWVRRKVNGNRENNGIRISYRRESHGRTNTGVRRKEEIYYHSRTVRVTARDSSGKVNHLSEVVWDKKKL